MAPLRPLVWLVNLLLLGFVSYAGAAVSMQVLEQRLAGSTPPVQAAPPQAQEPEQRAQIPITQFQPVLDANIFGARRTNIRRDTSAADATAAQQTPAAAPAVPLSLTLTGTVLFGERAFAMVADGNRRNEEMYRLWDCLPAGEDHPTRTCAPNQGKLISVRRKLIVVDYLGERVTFDLSDAPAAPTAAVRSTARPSPAGGAPGTVPEASESSNAPFPITQDGNVLEVRVPSGEVASAFENFSEVLKQARVVPYTDESGTGFQIRNIRAGSIFQRIGLNNFDKIKAVNGEPITTADQALRLLTMFRNEKEILLDLERRNEPIQLNYVIE